MYKKRVYATILTTPPASLIFLSALRETNRALTINGLSAARRPLPKTLPYPCWIVSMTGARSDEAEAYSDSGTSVCITPSGISLL